MKLVLAIAVFLAFQVSMQSAALAQGRHNQSVSMEELKKLVTPKEPSSNAGQPGAGPVTDEVAEPIEGQQFDSEEMGADEREFLQEEFGNGDGSMDYAFLRNMFLLGVLRYTLDYLYWGSALVFITGLFMLALPDRRSWVTWMLVLAALMVSFGFGLQQTLRTQAKDWDAQTKATMKKKFKKLMRSRESSGDGKEHAR